MGERRGITFPSAVLTSVMCCSILSCRSLHFSSKESRLADSYSSCSLGVSWAIVSSFCSIAGSWGEILLSEKKLEFQRGKEAMHLLKHDCNLFRAPRTCLASACSCFSNLCFCPNEAVLC